MIKNIVLETPHVLVGAAIATKVVHPALAIPLALGSHFILEKVPHWNPHLNSEVEKYGHPTVKSTKIVIADATSALILGSLIAYRSLPNTTLALTILASCFVSVLPDLVEAPYFFLGVRTKLGKRWILWQKSIQENTGVTLGLGLQLLTSLVAVWWIFS